MFLFLFFLGLGICWYLQFRLGDLGSKCSGDETEGGRGRGSEQEFPLLPTQVQAAQVKDGRDVKMAMAVRP